METFNTIATTTALVLLLLAVLRHRQHPLPAPLRVGVFIAPVGMIFAMAQMVLGTARIDAMLVGENAPNHSQSTFSINGTEVSHSYFVVMQLFHLVASAGMLLIAIGLMMLVRRIIRHHTPDPLQS